MNRVRFSKTQVLKKIMDCGGDLDDRVNAFLQENPDYRILTITTGKYGPEAWLAGEDVDSPAASPPSAPTSDRERLAAAAKIVAAMGNAQVSGWLIEIASQMPTRAEIIDRVELRDLAVRVRNLERGWR